MIEAKRKDQPAAGRNARFCVSTIGMVSVPCLLLVFGILAGCEGNAKKKAALTDEEIQRLSYASKPSRPDELLVSGEVITCEDIMVSSSRQTTAPGAFREKLVQLARAATFDEFMELARPQVRQRLNSNITDIVLYKRAKRTLGDKVDDALNSAAEKELRRFVLEHGGNNAQADEALKAMGRNRTTFKEYAKKQMLAEYAFSSRLARNRPITYSELVAAYDRMKDAYFGTPGVVQFRLIDIQVAEMASSDPNGDPARAARALAESLVTRIMAGEDFAALAEKYSHGFRAASGGLWTPRDPESLAEPYTILADAARQIDVGQIAGPLDVPGHAFIMKLEQKGEKGYRPLAEVQDQVEKQIAEDRNLEALRQLDEEIAQETALADTDRFLHYCLEQLYRSANASAQTR